MSASWYLSLKQVVVMEGFWWDSFGEILLEGFWWDSFGEILLVGFFWWYDIMPINQFHVRRPC